MVSAVRSRGEYEKEEAERLAPWAMRSAESRGRVVDEPEHAYRTAFQRDRDRIVHCRAFRRLQYKTQVFVQHEGDHYRNRLTHTLEAAQIARTLARTLRLNEELSEAIALAHDLGHTPFGHAGEAVLAELMAEHGGFDHNRQTLRTVDLLEERYPAFRGLNLTAETREGLLKHGCTWPHPVPLPPLGRQRCLEGQAADLADEVAYTNHDLDDGLTAGIVELAALNDVPLWAEARRRVEARLPDASERVHAAQTIVALINDLVTDAVRATAARLEDAEPAGPDGIRDAAARILDFAPATRAQMTELKAFLMENFYRSARVLRMTRKAEKVMGELFRTYCEDPKLLPARARAHFAREGEMRVIADHVAGMTDRFAMAEHKKLLDPHERI